MPDLREVYEQVTEQRSAAPGALERQRGWQRRYVRNRKLGTIVLSAALLVVAILVVVLAGTGVTDRGGRENEPAVRPTVSPVPGAYLFDLDTGMRTPVAGIESPGYLSPGIAVSPDGSMVAYAGNDPGGRLVVYVANADGTDIRPLERTGRDGSAIGPEFSPDGSQIVYQAKGTGNLAGDVFVVDIASGTTTRVTDLDPAYSSLWYMGPHFGPDGQTIYFTLPRTPGDSQGWDLWSVPASGGTPELVLRDAVGGRISPDGRSIVYFEARSLGESTLGDMWITDLDGSNPRRVVGVQGDVFSARWSPDGTRIAYTDLTARTASVVDVATGDVTRTLDDVNNAFPEWVNDHTWIVGEG